MVNQIETKKPRTSNASHSTFLAQFSRCFMQDLPPGLPSSRPEDHRIDTIKGSAPPCKAPYRVNPLEQREIKTHIEDLLQ